jgi:hypothetical protein
MKDAPRIVSLLVGAVWLTMLNAACGAPPAADAADPGPVPSVLRNGGFEEGLAGWTVTAAADFAEIAAVDDVTAPEGRKVLHVAHRRTRTSSLSTQATLEPWSYYLGSISVRGGPYLRSGMGLLLRPWDLRFSEADLGETWQTVRLPLVSGADGVVPISITLHCMAGEVWLDNLTLQKCAREDLRRIFGSDTPSGIPLVGLQQPNTAAASVWHDEMPVSTRLASAVQFSVRHTLAAEVWKNSGRLCLELPAAVHVRPDVAQTTPNAAGSRQTHRFAMPEAILWVDLTLPEPLGQDRQARFWAEWEGGRQEPVERELTEINVPSVVAPREIVTGTVVYGSTLATYPDYPAVIRSLGFNHLDSWGVGFSAEHRQALRSSGIDVSLIGPCPGYMKPFSEDPEARATTLDGRRVDAVCLSSRGRLHEKFLEEIVAYTKDGFAGMMFDDESFCDWDGMDACFCNRCLAEWRAWLAKNRPGLAPLEPAVALDDPFAYPEHYRAWWTFRATQLTEWYRSMKTTFLAATTGNPAVGGGPRPRLAIQAGTPEFASIKTTRLNLAELADVFDLICPQFYGGGESVARRTRDLVREVGRDKACPTLCLGERYEWEPGEFRAQILEAVFAGARGYTSWGWPYANLRIIAEAAETNGVLATHETILRQGTATTTFWTAASRGRVAVLETATAGLLLVSNDSRGGTPAVIVQRRPGTAVVLTEVFTGATVRLTPGDAEFSAAVQPGTVALWTWDR